jgi:hypothetical protein
MVLKSITGTDASARRKLRDDQDVGQRSDIMTAKRNLIIELHRFFQEICGTWKIWNEHLLQDTASSTVLGSL